MPVYFKSLVAKGEESEKNKNFPLSLPKKMKIHFLFLFYETIPISANTTLSSTYPVQTFLQLLEKTVGKNQIAIQTTTEFLPFIHM